MHVRRGLGRVEVEEMWKKVNKKEESVIWVWRDVPGVIALERYAPISWSPCWHPIAACSSRESYMKIHT